MAGKKPSKAKSGSKSKAKAKASSAKATPKKAPLAKAKSKTKVMTKAKGKPLAKAKPVARVAKAKGKPAAKAKAKSAPKAESRTPGVPMGKRTVTPYLVIEGAADAIEFYKAAFGACENMRMAAPGNKVMHAEIQIGDSMLMIADDFPEMTGGQSRSPLKLGNTPVTIHLYVGSVDDVFERAVGAGCQVVMPPSDMFWGDRFSCVKDPFGHMWSIATCVNELSPDELNAAAAAAFANPNCGGEQGHSHEVPADSSQAN